MSFFDEANEDAMSVTVDQAATGPRVGFLQAFENSYNAQTRASAMYGIENEIQNLESTQLQRMRDAGIDTAEMPVLGPSMPNYMDVARFYEDGGDPDLAGRLQDYDKRIDKLREKYPDLGLMNSQELWGDVKAKAKMYEDKFNTSRTTLGGTVGNFLGSTVGAFNPESDPLNALTLNVGGAAKTVLGRIATQGAAQGIIEGVNQITGVQEERRLLGLDYGLGDALYRVGGAVVAGAAVQGIGEGLAVGVRRFFKSTPKDFAPIDGIPERPVLPDTSNIPRSAIPADENLAAAKLTRDPQSFENYVHEQSVLSRTRQGRAVSMIEMDYITQKLEAWDGPKAWEVPPKTDTMIKPGTVVTGVPDMTRFVEKSQIDANARLIDPDTFKKYDALAARKDSYRRWLDELGTTQDLEVAARLDIIDDKIYELTRKAEDQGGKRAAKTRADIRSLEAEKAEIVKSSDERSAPSSARVRASLLADDIKMRDLAPLVSRAYARANEKWVNTEGDRKAIYDMMRNGRQRIEPTTEADNNIINAVEAALSDQAPILRGATRPDVKLPANGSPSDVASAVLAADAKIMTEAVERFSAQISGILGKEGETQFFIPGVKEPLDLDKTTIYVPIEDGEGGREVSLRQLLEDVQNDKHEVEAVSSCSLR